MARDGGNEGLSFRQQDPVAKILSLAESIRSLRARAHGEIAALSPADKKRYKETAEALPAGETYF
ncbi:MAG: hypothetical protein V4437_02050 [Patescibacteria group bacterium]